MAKGLSRSTTARGRSNQSNALVTALSGLTDGLYGMFAKRLELFRLELIADAQGMAVWMAVLLVCSVVLALGYGLVNLAAVLLVGTVTTAAWAPGVTAAGLGAVNLAVAGAVGWVAFKRLADARAKMNHTVDEFKRDRKWLDEIRDEDSPQETPTTTSEAAS